MSTRTPLEAAILISGRGSNMMAIARACLAGTIAATPSGPPTMKRYRRRSRPPAPG